MREVELLILVHQRLANFVPSDDATDWRGLIVDFKVVLN